MIFRIYPTKDTFITNDFRCPSYTQLTGANVGASEELEVFKRAGISGAIGTIGSSSLGRSLLQFDFSAFCALTASGDIPTKNGITFTLVINHKTHAGKQPTSYDMLIQPISSSWDEGLGKDIGELKDNGFANWVKKDSSSFWNTQGGDFLSQAVIAHFDTGTENIEKDITSIVDLWLSGTIPNNGIVVKMTGTIESDTNYTDFYQKKFYSRQTSFADRAPYIEARVNDFNGDDRVNMKWARTGSLFLYDLVGGSFQDLIGEIIVDIQDASGTLLSLTASHGQIGIYSASFALPSASYSGSVFYDKWRLESNAIMTGTFTISSTGPVQSISQVPLSARIRNMQDEYLPEDVPVFEVFFRNKKTSQPIFFTASLGVFPHIAENAFYAIENDSTRERVIPFGTGSQNHTKLSYGENGNSFKLFMTNLHSGNVYRVIFLVNEQGRKQIIDGGFRFKVV